MDKSDILNNTLLAAAEKTFRDIFNYSSDLIYIQDLDGIFIDVNQTVLDKYGYTKDELIGQSPEILGAEGKNDMSMVVGLIKKAWKNNQAQSFEWWSRKKDGTEFLKEIVVRRGRYFDRDVIIATGRDITERKEAEEKLRERNKELKKVNGALDAFVYSASHDLKAPLSSLKGLLNLMSHEEPENLGEYILKMQQSVEKLDQFVHDLVDYSRNAKMDLTIEKVRINDKIKQIVNELKYSEAAENIVFDLQFNAPKEVYSDNFRLRVILTNLISNAIRYHDPSKNKKYIIVKSALKNNRLSIEVIDNGIGIDKSHHKDIFKMFFRANEKIKEGSGLGLFMVNEAVELLKGEINLTSSLGSGTKIEVMLPVQEKVKAIVTG